MLGSKVQIPLINFFVCSCRILQHHRFISMASQSYFDSPTALTTDYPIPLSPPLPDLSKDIEPNRALTASSKSSLFTLSRTHVIFEDEWLIAVNKPQGIYCENVLSALPHLLNDTGANVSELHLANRLDRDTSGVMLITKLHKVAAKFVKAFTDHKVRKTYLAFCVGLAPKWEKITVKSGHGRSKYGAWRVYAASDVGRKLPGGSVVRDMETSFEVLSVNGLGCSKVVSDLQKDEAVVIVQEKSVIGCDLKKDEILVRASPRSGRTHQIRLHCQYLGIPIRGDVRYEGVYEWKGSIYDGHELHAESLSFEHPITGEPILLQAPLPSWAIQPLRSQIE
ncbi:RNA pseudouridine synthase 1 [Lycium barbarum]|uniref:RNA pseudouridine synthase 1 n=1 Tax=Lycium barbarum TaxID=112863 RepID=UPI00293E48EC|nr:RNA pseudouridine synthase 1 [Lycium barbarum]XP_060167279.1 RNA pseudouridine synthase 1 [Lycium barbarum]